jgi:hypothetical protein
MGKRRQRKPTATESARTLQEYAVGYVGPQKPTVSPRDALLIAALIIGLALFGWLASLW